MYSMLREVALVEAAGRRTTCMMSSGQTAIAAVNFLAQSINAVNKSMVSSVATVVNYCHTGMPYGNTSAGTNARKYHRTWRNDRAVRCGRIGTELYGHNRQECPLL